MLANSWASAGGTLTSRRTRSVADARSAARSCAIVTRPGAGPREGEADPKARMKATRSPIPRAAPAWPGAG